jgi:glycerol-3-phosphate O-acyltransferase
MTEKRHIYEHVIPNIEEWPIYKLSEDRRQFVREIDEFILQRFLQKPTSEVTDIISKTIYLERIRMKEDPWKVDPPNERQFWGRIQKQLMTYSLDRSEEEAMENNEELLRKIINRYSEEIVGTFRIKTFLFARKFLTLFFNRLLNTAAGRNLHRFWGTKHRLEDRLLVKGKVEQIRTLMKKGTVVLVPTHFSNLDSILIGYAIDTFAGLPSFSYGAGLNLYNSGWSAYFINRLGAYRVDRRKKNAIYLETLKGMSNLSIQRGVNSLFFPGGTRSRSGQLETQLKLGLMGTVIEAQRANFQKGKKEKIFVVPLILSYHFVLEAQFLIDQHLKRMGKERYLKSKSKDAFYSIRSLLKFAWQFFSTSNEIILSFGQPMDVIGNPVDEDGNSFDQYGNLIHLEEYFYTNGKVAPDYQRESQYTKQLAVRIVERYHKDNIVLTSHLVAFSAFEMLKRQYARLDLYGLLRLPTDEYVFSYALLYRVVEQLQKKLIEMEEEGNIRLSDAVRGDIDELIRDGVKRLGTYHLSKPLRINKKGEIVSDSFKVLYFYHNRLENYQLDKVIQLQKPMPQPIS